MMPCASLSGTVLMLLGNGRPRPGQRICHPSVLLLFGEETMSYNSSIPSGKPAQDIDHYVMSELRGQYALLGKPVVTKRTHGRKDRPMWRRRMRALLAIPSRS